jgi:hypothetical protein
MDSLPPSGFFLDDFRIIFFSSGRLWAPRQIKTTNKRKINQTIMKNLSKAAVLSAMAVLAGQAAYAQIAADDLILGFNKSGKSDYVIDLGAFSSLSTTAVTHLGADASLTTFNTTFTSLAGVNAAVVGGNNSTVTGVGDAYLDKVRVGAINGPLTAGTETALSPVSRNQIALAGSDVNSVNAGVNGDFTSFIGTSTTDNGSGTFLQNLNAPLGTSLADFSSGVLTLDIFKATRPASGNSGWAFDGTVSLDFTGGSPIVDFTPAGFSAAVPEPSTYGMLAGGGLLALALRRQFRRVNA